MKKNKRASPGTVIITILMILVLIAGISFIVRCSRGDDSPVQDKKLASVTLSSDKTHIGSVGEVNLSWTESGNADYYVVFISYGSETESLTCTDLYLTVTISVPGEYSFYVVAKSATGAYLDSDNSNTVTVLYSIDVENLLLSDSSIIF